LFAFKLAVLAGPGHSQNEKAQQLSFDYDSKTENGKGL
jgi:hypothetical protein